jgi:hypothetical protein
LSEAAGRLQKGLDKMEATAVQQKRMTVGEVRAKAKGLGICPGKMKKVELIHTIQRAEGCTACFGWSNGQCEEMGCCFRVECLKTSL